MEVAMRKKIFLTMLIGLALLSIPKRVLAQDSDKVVIMSSRVGAVIDAAERDRFRLFPQIEGFKQAVVCKTPNNTYYIVIISVTPEGKAKETTVGYRESDLLTLAEQIDHFEDLQKGIYRMGQEPAALRVVGPQAEAITKPPGQQLETLKVVDRQGQVVEQQPDLLPFSLKTAEPPLEIFPQLGVGVGISSSSQDLGGIARAFNAIEEKYRKQGYTIIHKSLNLDPPSLLRYTLALRFSPSLTLLVDAGKSLETEVQLKTVSASALYYFGVFEQRWLRPFAGGGIVFSHFSFEKEYGDRISPIQSRGVYNYLESISTEGGNTGFMLAAGVDLVPNYFSTFTVYLNYVAPSTTETTVSGIEPVSVKLAGLVAGARLSVYF
jgi:hypothetical protein